MSEILYADRHAAAQIWDQRIGIQDDGYNTGVLVWNDDHRQQDRFIAVTSDSRVCCLLAKINHEIDAIMQVKLLRCNSQSVVADVTMFDEIRNSALLYRISPLSLSWSLQGLLTAYERKLKPVEVGRRHLQISASLDAPRSILE